jgi:hypothetical protein
MPDDKVYGVSTGEGGWDVKARGAPRRSHLRSLPAYVTFTSPLFIVPLTQKLQPIVVSVWIVFQRYPRMLCAFS